MRFAFASIVFLLVFVVGGIALQIWLSKRESRWPGLILPGLCVVYSLLMVLSFSPTPDMTTGEMVGGILSVLLLCNIPTLVFAAIYASCRKKHRQKAQLEKMRAQDLG